MAADPDGNLYFSDTTLNATHRGIYRLDPLGRLIEVVSFAERQAAFQVGTTSLNVTPLHMQPRTATYAGPNGAFPLTQILYQESSPYSFVAGAYVFKPGDFNRDNTVDYTDMKLFQQALTVPGVQASTANLKYDLNGNGQVTWKDVKILQQFVSFPDGDTNMDGRVDVADLLALAKDWQDNNETWTGGDFNGDGIVDLSDLQTLADNWTAGVNTPTFSETLTELGLAALPEPGCLTPG
jgi:hypothetical protein